MRIAIVTRDLPLPPGTGLNLVIHNLVKGLAERHEVRFFILQRGYYNYKVPGNANDPALFPWAFEECPAGASDANGHHLSRPTRYYGIQPGKIDWLAQRIQAFGADRIVGFDFNLAPYLALLPGDTPKILDAVDSEILYYKNQIVAGNLKTGVLKHLAAAWLMGREHIRKFNAVVTVSAADSRNIASATGARKVFTVPNGVTMSSSLPNPGHPAPGQSSRVLRQPELCTQSTGDPLVRREMLGSHQGRAARCAPVGDRQEPVGRPEAPA